MTLARHKPFRRYIHPNGFTVEYADASYLARSKRERVIRLVIGAIGGIAFLAAVTVPIWAV